VPSEKACGVAHKERHSKARMPNVDDGVQQRSITSLEHVGKLKAARASCHLAPNYCSKPMSACTKPMSAANFRPEFWEVFGRFQGAWLWM